MATVTMEGRATLTERSARAAIQAAGFKVVSFEEGEPRKATAYLFRTAPLEPDARVRLENGLREDLKDAEWVAVDSLGRATVVVSRDVEQPLETISASTRKRGVEIEGFETKRWPKLDAAYVVALSGMDGTDEARSVSDALTGVSKVVAVHVYEETGTARLWLKEPCDALEANVKAALVPVGLTVSRFELVRSGRGN